MLCLGWETALAKLCQNTGLGSTHSSVTDLLWELDKLLQLLESLFLHLQKEDDRMMYTSQGCCEN